MTASPGHPIDMNYALKNTMALVLAGEDDHFVPLGMAREFVDALGGPTTLRVFTTDEGAGEHCQVGNLRLATNVIYDWLDGTL